MINLLNSVPTAAEDNETGQITLSQVKLFLRYCFVWFVPWLFLALYQNANTSSQGIDFFRSSGAELLRYWLPTLLALCLLPVLAALTTIADVKNWLRSAAFIFLTYSAVLLSCVSYFIIDAALKLSDDLYANVLAQLFAVVAIMVGGGCLIQLTFIMVKGQKLQDLFPAARSCCFAIWLLLSATVFTVG